MGPTFVRGLAQAPTEGTVSEEESAESDWSLYDYPTLYDRVFGYRDFAEEVEFIKDVHTKVCGGREAHTFLEIGCGPARHSIQLAGQGAAAYALDNNAGMLEYARELAAAESASVTFLEADMDAFSLPSGVRADVAFLPLGVLAHALTNEAAAATLRACRDALRPGGVVLVELPHPEDIFNGQLLMGDAWDIEAEEDAPALMVEFGNEDYDEFDAATQVVRRRLVVSKVEPVEGGQEGDAQIETLGEGTVLQRVFTLQELDLLGRAAGLELAATYGDFDTGVTLDNEEAYRLLVCLQRPDDGAAQHPPA